MAMGVPQAMVEKVMARHAGNALRQSGSGPGIERPAPQHHNFVTANVRPGDPVAERQDASHAVAKMRDRIAEAFSPDAREKGSLDRAVVLAKLKATLEDLHRRNTETRQRSDRKQDRTRLLLERERLLLTNEIAEAVGRTEVWIFSIAFLVLVFAHAVNVYWALPILLASVLRSWHLDRQCKRRLAKVAEIERIIKGAKAAAKKQPKPPQVQSSP